MSANKSEEYNGWSNYETWLVKLWIDNEQSTQEYWLGVARTMEQGVREGMKSEYHTDEQAVLYGMEERLKDEFEDATPLGDDASVWHDLLGAALSRVDWREIAEALIEDAKELAE